MPIYIDSATLPTSVEAGKPFILSVSARHVPLTWGMLATWGKKWRDVEDKTWKTVDTETGDDPHTTT